MIKMLRPLALALALLCGAPAQAAIAYVQAAGNGRTFTSGSSITVSGITSTANNTIVIVTSYPDADTISSVTDSAGNTYTHQVTLDNTAGVVVNKVSIYTCLSAASATTWTVTLSGSDIFHYVGVVEYSGVAAIGTNTSAPAPAAFGNSVTTGTLTLTTQDANNYVVGGWAWNQGGASSMTWGAGTGRLLCDSASTPACGTTSLGTRSNSYFGMSDATNASAASTSITQSWTGSSEITGVAVELRSTTGGGGPPAPVHSGMSGFWGLRLELPRPLALPWRREDSA